MIDISYLDQKIMDILQLPIDEYDEPEFAPNAGYLNKIVAIMSDNLNRINDKVEISVPEFDIYSTPDGDVEITYEVENVYFTICLSRGEIETCTFSSVDDSGVSRDYIEGILFNAPMSWGLFWDAVVV